MPSRGSGAWLAAIVAAATFYAAYDDGSYSLGARNTAALVVWWALLMGVAWRAWRLERLGRGAAVTGLLLALFSAWTLASTAWASDNEAAVAEFDRSVLYLGVFLVAALTGRRLRPWLDGLTVGIVAIALVALVSRLFPGSFGARDLPAVLPSSSTRLSFPLDYWNGLGIFVALAVPLLLREGLTAGRVRRAAAIGVVPALAAVVYLTSSRGAALAGAAGALVFVAVQRPRWPALAQALAAAVGCAVAVAVLAPRHALVDGPLASSRAHAEGHQAAVLLVLVCVATAALVEAGRLLAARRPGLARAPNRLWAWAALAGLLAVGAYEARSLRHFTQVPDLAASSTTSQHLLSGTGSGRWQFWKAALDEFAHHPLHGGGAGSFATWWGRHATFPYFVQDAHSVFFQTLAELGLVGFVLLVGALVAGILTGVRKLPAERAAIGALLGALTVYLVGASVDWMWQLPAVSAVGLAILGLLAAPASAPSPAPARRRARVLASAFVLTALAVLALETIPLLGQLEIGASQAAVRSGRAGPARTQAIRATRIEPWAASPYLQLALVEEASGRLESARKAASEAIRRDPDDWRPWQVAARIDARLGRREAARQALERARELDPTSESDS